MTVFLPIITSLFFLIFGFLAGKVYGIKKAGQKMTSILYSEGIINSEEVTKYYSVDKLINKNRTVDKRV